jgi:uncharacterized protein YraI
MKRVIKSAIIAVALFSATAAQAANAIVTTNLNLRTGPGTNYQSLGAIPNGARVDVRGCTSGYGWCQVDYAGRFGWASSRYLAIREGSSGNYNNNNFGSTAALIGIPLIAGVVIGSAISNNNKNDHWDRPHYRPKPSHPSWNNNHRPRPPHSNWNGNNRPKPSQPGWNGNHNNRPHNSNSGRPSHGGNGPHRR